MPLASTLTKRHNAGGVLTAIVAIVPSGNYATGGEVVDFPAIVGLTDRKPDFVDINGKAGFVYMYDLATEKMLVFTNTAGAANAPLGEHTAAAYVAGILADVITATAIWVGTPKLS